MSDQKISYIQQKSFYTQFFLAIKDLSKAFHCAPLWMMLAWVDIKIRYKGSKLGPFWITLSMMIFIGALGVVYSRLFHESLSVYIPFLTCGFLVWTFIATTLIDSCFIFVNARHYILQVRLPYLLYIFRCIWRNTIIFMHNALVYFLVMLYFHLPIHGTILWFIPAFILTMLNLGWVALFIAIISARFRDVHPIVTSLIQVLFFVSPVTWMPKLVGPNSLIVQLNPVAYFMNLLREPLLGSAPSLTLWLFCLVFTALGWLFIFPVFTFARRYIPYWI